MSKFLSKFFLVKFSQCAQVGDKKANLCWDSALQTVIKEAPESKLIDQSGTCE